MHTKKITEPELLTSKLAVTFAVAGLSMAGLGVAEPLAVPSAKSQLPTVQSPGPRESLLQALVDLPQPNLEAEEVEVRGQLESGRDRLEALITAAREMPAAGAVDPVTIAELAEAYADLGRLYYIYQLLEVSEIALTNALALVPEATEWRYVRAALRVVAGAQDEALQDFRTILAAEPRNVAARVRAADLLYDLARYEEAKADYLAATTLDPNEAAAWAGRGQVAARQGEHAQAVEFLRRALELQPSAVGLNYPLAQSLRQLGQTQEARAVLALHKEGVVKLKEPVLDGLGTSNRSSLALLHAGNSAMRRGEMKQAADYFQRFILRRPEHAVATHNLGLVLMADQQRTKGMAALRKAVELDPDFRGGHYFLGSALAEDGLFEEAVGHYRRAHELDPLEQTIHADYAALIARMGSVQQALAELRPIVESDPDAHYVRLKYATILAVAGRSEEARPLLEKVSEAGMEKSMRAEALYHLGLLRLNAGQFEDAQRLLEQSVSLGPGSGPSNAALAKLLGRAGNLAGAAEHFTRALRAQPLDDEYHFGRAMALLLADRDTDARQALEEAVTLLPQHRALRHLLARVLAASSDAGARDGARAVALAQNLMDQAPSLEYAETLAMALAEVGRFSDAAQLQGRVLAGSSPEAGPSYQQRQAHLQSFEQQRPVRDPWELR